MRSRRSGAVATEALAPAAVVRAARPVGARQAQLDRQQARRVVGDAHLQRARARRRARSACRRRSRGSTRRGALRSATARRRRAADGRDRRPAIASRARRCPRATRAARPRPASRASASRGRRRRSCALAPPPATVAPAIGAGVVVVPSVRCSVTVTVNGVPGDGARRRRQRQREDAFRMKPASSRARRTARVALLDVVVADALRRRVGVVDPERPVVAGGERVRLAEDRRGERHDGPSRRRPPRSIALAGACGRRSRRAPCGPVVVRPVPRRRPRRRRPAPRRAPRRRPRTATSMQQQRDGSCEETVGTMGHVRATPFREGVSCWWPEAGLLASGPTVSRLPGPRVRGPVAALCERVRVASPVTVAGPRRFRTGFPSPPTNDRASVALAGRHDGQPDAHLHEARRRRRDAPRRHEPRAQDAPADRGLRRRRRAQRADRRRARASSRCPSATASGCARIQNDLFDVGADLSVPERRRARAPARARRAGRPGSRSAATRSTRRSSR